MNFLLKTGEIPRIFWNFDVLRFWARLMQNGDQNQGLEAPKSTPEAPRRLPNRPKMGRSECGPNLFLCGVCPEGAPDALRSMYVPKRGSEKGQKGRFFVPKSLQREVREQKLRFFLQKCRSAANTAWRESKWLSGRSRIDKNRSRRVKN